MALNLGAGQFDIGTYRNSSPISDTTSFDQLLASCHYVMELDGRYVSGGTGKRQRSRAYRQQGGVLLRQCDLLIALDEIGHEGSAGGTAETINRAFAIGMKVLYLPTNANMIRLVGNATELENVHEQSHDNGSTHNGWRDALKVCVEDILCNPSRTYPGGSRAAEESKEAGTEFLEEYFGLIENKPSWREKFWYVFADHFKATDRPTPQPDPPLVQFEAFRRRATALNYYYIGLYRGTFLTNYTLAVLAVTLAVISL